MPKAKVLSKITIREKGKFVKKAAGETVEVSQVAIDAMPTKLKAIVDKPKNSGGAKQRLMYGRYCRCNKNYGYKSTGQRDTDIC